ncbi:WD40-repeat-containing domain protein [Cercophora scortea]|uniref:WD40-repeat-containing domain protein n=1 Tax=Cercophora scortea TaxID=314031 RepID=A0AAE0IL87_9PEZI|nr:WD40-repeat-containing domain protein [Cercophora scortea]
MRLLHANSNGSFELTRDLPEDKLSEYPYAILSHTWLSDDEKEVTFGDMTSGIAESKPDSFAKIKFCGEQAARHGLKYFWVDTCCIDKGNSSELQEAITSMFSWYQNAERCYTYLSDVSVAERPGTGIDTLDWEPAFRRSKWFTRGWTLQELLAPKSVELFSVEGIRLGDRRSLEQCIHEITGIPHRALQGEDLSNFSVADRQSWSEEKRTTKRKEDMAYCLFGILGVMIPIMYGEGANAVVRLRHEIDKQDEINQKLEESLSALPVASLAAFNSNNNQYKPTCLPGTRSELLRVIEEWADGDDDSCIYWLNGIAGTGKSTVAQTIAMTYHNRGSLGASFFFSRGGGDVGNATRLITTLARQLADAIPSTKRNICKAAMEQKEIATRSFQDQWDHLILRPLSKLKRHSPPSTVMIVMDALDECESQRDISILLKVMASARLLKNIRLRIFITSRPEMSIRYDVGKIPEAERKVFLLHEISPALVDKDLSLFFEDNLWTLRDRRNMKPSDWPGARIIKRLVEISCGLFIWASIACRYIYGGGIFANRRVDVLINGYRSGEGPEKQLDQIYTTVLHGAIQQDYNAEEKKVLYQVLRQVLGSIVVLSSPLSTESLAKLRDIDQSVIDQTLEDLHTIFIVPSQTSLPVRLHHPTFRDFLLNRDRCSDLNFWVDEKQAHEALAEGCIKIMSEQLKADMCSLKHPGALLKDVDQRHIEKCISPELQYACVYWVQHYQKSGKSVSDGDEVHVFLQKHYLHWLETITLMGKSSDMGAIIRLYHSILVPTENVRQVPWAKDVRRFFFAFQSIIKEAPLQTYCAALAFIPSNNELKQQFRHEMHPWIQDIRIAERIAKAKDEFNYVNDLAFTPDSKRVASGSNPPVVRLWDIATKRAVCQFEGPMDKISSVSISPDGATIAGGSDDFTVMAWDIRTRAVRYTLKAHSGWVNSVVFSPNGKLLMTASMDRTVAIWDALTGQELKRFDNQSSEVNSATFSPDSSLVATAAVDQMVRLWDISKRDTEVLRIKLDGHQGPINSVRFSPNGKCVVSGSDDMTIKIWDINTGTEFMTLNGHTRKVMAVTFSADASLIVSGSEDGTVRVWDAISGAQLHVLRGHTSGINAVVFSPNGRLLASGSFDDEVHLWDTKTWATLGELDEFDAETDNSSDTSAVPQQPLIYLAVPGDKIGGQKYSLLEKEEALDSISMPDSFDSRMWESVQLSQPPISVAPTKSRGHFSKVTCAVFSPSGGILASGSQDTTIKLWRRDGVEQRKLTGHSDSITHMAFSPDGQTLASASADHTVKLWSTETGALLHTLAGHSSAILGVLFSPDNQILASWSATDTSVLLWRTTTGATAARITGHTDTITDVAFSPDSTLVASASADTTVLLWDTITKTQQTLSGHGSSVISVAFSLDGDLLVSGSTDQYATIRLWNARTGALCDVIRSGAPRLNCVSVSPDKALLALCSSDETARLWDLNTRTAKGLLKAGVEIKRIAFSTANDTAKLRLLETDRGALDVSSFSVPSSSSGSSFLPKTPRADGLFVTKQWVTRDMENVLRLPEEYLATVVATSGEAVVMGHESGGLSFVYLRGREDDVMI